MYRNAPPGAMLVSHTLKLWCVNMFVCNGGVNQTWLLRLSSKQWRPKYIYLCRVRDALFETYDQYCKGRAKMQSRAGINTNGSQTISHPALVLTLDSYFTGPLRIHVRLFRNLDAEQASFELRLYFVHFHIHREVELAPERSDLSLANNEIRR